MNEEEEGVQSPLEAHELGWTPEIADEATRQGWDIFDCDGSSHGRWQVQHFDDAECAGEGCDFTVPQLASDADAWRLVKSQQTPCQVVALSLIKQLNMPEYDRIISVPEED